MMSKKIVYEKTSVGAIRWRMFKKNKRAIFGLVVLALMYLAAGFSFLNAWAGYRWLQDPNDVRIGEKFYEIKIVKTPENFAVLDEEELNRFPQLREGILNSLGKMPIKDKEEISRLEDFLDSQGIGDAAPLNLYKKVYYVKYGEFYEVSILNVENQPSSFEHPFGTDDFGRDVLSRV
ncbi:MAG: hypothetical protein ACE5KJ_06760, partial [Candidatus Zixiibacteriota bacterium]